MSKQAVYGFPCVTNPHDFEPDHECCSPAEKCPACDGSGVAAPAPAVGCLNCGEQRDGGYFTAEGNVGPFCENCWHMLRDEFAAPAPETPEDLDEIDTSGYDYSGGGR